MNDVREARRLPSPAPRPLGLAFDGERLWMGSLETCRVYSIDPLHWTATDEAQAPGYPFGMQTLGDELRVVIGMGDEDDRYVYRFVPGHGFKESSRFACPDLTGSHLAFDGDTLFLSQAANKRIFALDGAGTPVRTIGLPCRLVGMTIVDGNFYVVAADEEVENLHLTQVDARGETPVVTELAKIPFAARGLTWDGSLFWTSHRDQHEIVAFEKPA
ncbi:MAG: hypothetical protein JO199_13230 [Candidatus Eremiobacteraeota bacterium]|nr:hypothetical protein [Candidatus Eremiobacteraeota bacterium]